MEIIRSCQRMALRAKALRGSHRRIGVVPTMGALHEGHASLILAADFATDFVIVTLFVNPLQFGPKDDFARYPRTFRQDLKLAAASGADLLFCPAASDIYPEGFQSVVEVPGLARRWEGESRPGHFRGVATIVSILLNLTQPTDAYFGQKDYQQSQIIRRMVKDLRLPIAVHIRPTIRERDGLAKSSRNRYLDPQQRKQAAVLYQALQLGRRLMQKGERRPAAVLQAMRRLIGTAADARIDYASAVDAETLEPLTILKGRLALLLAVRIGSTRLIDNLIIRMR